jgi:hypothetical protein
MLEMTTRTLVIIIVVVELRHAKATTRRQYDQRIVKVHRESQLVSTRYNVACLQFTALNSKPTEQ